MKFKPSDEMGVMMLDDPDLSENLRELASKTERPLFPRPRPVPTNPATVTTLSRFDNGVAALATLLLCHPAMEPAQKRVIMEKRDMLLRESADA